MFCNCRSLSRRVCYLVDVFIYAGSRKLPRRFFSAAGSAVQSCQTLFRKAAFEQVLSRVFHGLRGDSHDLSDELYPSCMRSIGKITVFSIDLSAAIWMPTGMLSEMPGRKCRSEGAENRSQRLRERRTSSDSSSSNHLPSLSQATSVEIISGKRLRSRILRRKPQRLGRP